MKKKMTSFAHGHFSRANLTIFAIIFAAIGGYFIYSSFAATSLTCTTTISTSTEFSDAVKNAAAGSVTCLSSGSYSWFSVLNSTRSDYATFQPAPGANVTIAGLQLQSSNYLRFQNFNIAQNGATTILLSDHIQFIDNNVSGQGFKVNATKQSLWQGNNIHDVTRTAGAGAPDGYGMWINSYYIGDVNSLNATDGLDGLVIKGNTFSNIPQDGIQLGGGRLHHTRDVTIEGNQFDHIAATLDTDHSDSIQIIGGDNITVRSNRFEHVQDACMFKDDVLADSPVENNLMIASTDTAGGTGIMCQIWDSTNLTFRNNTLVKYAGLNLLLFRQGDDCCTSIQETVTYENNALIGENYGTTGNVVITANNNYFSASASGVLDTTSYDPVAGSPLIDAANANASSTDRLGRARYDDPSKTNVAITAADIGAQEYNGTEGDTTLPPSPPPSGNPKTGDINNDGSVDIFDLSILLSNYNGTTASCDLNTDGTVNIFDLSILLSNYGT